MLGRAQQVMTDMEYTCYNYGCYYALHGQPEVAMDWLEKAFSAYEPFRGMAVTDEDLASLRELERFKRIPKKK